MATSSPRVWLLAAAALALACVLVATSADAEAPAPSSSSGGSVFGCNPITDKTCKPPQGMVVLPSGGIDIDGDGDEDELPGFDTHLTILGHAH
ncbi:hypothetical protein BS78_04G066900 [Paspalum vaginatum]|nr:hypothetical protein BS78_04G066900 [Paspalum vaginatum]